jgi:hypothetical protein
MCRFSILSVGFGSIWNLVKKFYHWLNIHVYLINTYIHCKKNHSFYLKPVFEKNCFYICVTNKKKMTVEN